MKGEEKLLVETCHRLGTDDDDRNDGADKPNARVERTRVIVEMLMAGMYFDENNRRIDVDQELRCGMMGRGEEDGRSC